MEQNEFAGLTDEELLKAKKKANNTRITHAFLIGIFIGVAVYAAANNGFGFSVLFPLVFVYLFAKNEQKTNTLKEELKKRNLE